MSTKYCPRPDEPTCIAIERETKRFHPKQDIRPAVPLQKVPHGAGLARLRPAPPIGRVDARLEGALGVKAAEG